MTYLDFVGFRSRSNLPAMFVDEVEDASPGWTATLLADLSAEINARLAKRYATPFNAPYPIAVIRWLVRLADPYVLRKRGIDQTDQQYADLEADSQRVRDQMKEAADSNTGLYDLPLRADTNETGISKSDTFCYSEASSYVFRDVQGERAREENRNGRGSYD